MSVSDDVDLEALLIEAEVKEDFSNLGFDDEVVKSLVLDSQDQVVPKPDEEKPVASTSLGEKCKLGVVTEVSDFCLSYIGSGVSFCLRKNCCHSSSGRGARLGSVEDRIKGGSGQNSNLNDKTRKLLTTFCENMLE